MGDAELKSKDPGGKRKSPEMMEKYRDIQIRWANGKAVVHLDKFFPATATEIRKLLKMVNLDILHRDRIIRQMLSFLESWNDVAWEKAEECLGLKQKYAEYRERAASKKHPNGIPLTKDELKDVRELRDSYKRAAVVCEREYKQLCSREQKIKKNLELIRKLTGR